MGKYTGFKDFGNWASGLDAIGSIMQGFGGLQQAKVGRQQNELTDMFGRKNFNQQANAFNERLETRGRSRLNRSSFDSGGQSLADVMSQYGAKKMDVSQFASANNAAPGGQLQETRARPALERTNQSPTRNLPATY